MKRRLCLLALLMALVSCQAAPTAPVATSSPSRPSSEPPRSSVALLPAFETQKAAELDYPAGDFYDVPDPMPSGAAGELMRTRLLRQDDDARIYLVMYRSATVDGTTPVAVTGVIWVPTGAAPDDGFPIVAWGPGFDGVGDDCSYSHRLFGENSDYDGAISQLVREGYVVAVTDFEGHGTRFPYLVQIGESGTHALLDAARAARDLLGPAASDRIVVAGHSLGANMAAQALLFGPDYDDGLDVRAVLAFDGGLDLLDINELVLLYTAMQYSQQFDGLRLEGLLTPQGLEMIGRAEEFACAPYPYGPTPHPEQLWADSTFDDLFQAGAFDRGSWRDVTLANTVSDAPYPVWFALASDGPARQVLKVVSRICENSDRAFVSIPPGADHDSVVEVAYDVYGPWLAERVTGDTPVHGCQGLAS
jgi:pimeloyl-ACP methyl ester carboxylesterase